jgi:hypothetical protein
MPSLKRADVYSLSCKTRKKKKTLCRNASAMLWEKQKNGTILPSVSRQLVALFLVVVVWVGEVGGVSWYHELM